MAECDIVYPFGWKTPNNNYSSPIPSRLRGMASAIGESPDESDEDRDKQEELPLPDYLFSPIPTRRSLFKRVAHLNRDFGSREHQPHTLQASKSQDDWIKKRRNKKGERIASDKSTPDSTEGSMSPTEKNEEGEDQDQLPQDLHWEAIERVLFIYAKLNPGVGYVQGMNEILGPLYYLLANDPDEVSRAHAEAESFWLFHLLMAHFRDHFVRSLDRDRMSGIGSTIARMNFRLRQFDEDLWQNLEEKGIAPEYYSFRWLTVLCTQEFEVPDVWRIWDSVLADTGGIEKDYDFLLDFGCAMVCHLRSELVGGDFADNVKLLQNYPPVDIQPILHLATVIRDHRVSGIGTNGGIVGNYTHQQQEQQQQQQQATLDIKEPTPRSSIDLRIWSSRSSIHESSSSFHSHHQRSNSAYSEKIHQDMKALTIDGVRNSDRLDHNIEGTDHRRSPLYIPISTTFKKNNNNKPPSISGMSMDGIWGRGPVSAGATAWDRRRSSSPSALSVDNYALSSTGRDSSRPQTATWAETFSLLKARLVGSGPVVSSANSTPTAGPMLAPTTVTMSAGSVNAVGPGSGTSTRSSSGSGTKGFVVGQAGGGATGLESLSGSVDSGFIIAGGGGDDFEIVEGQEGRVPTSITSFESIRVDTGSGGGGRVVLPGESVGVLSPSVEL
ncbi:hypothetical protein BGZ83_009969 [Gryganskiella cystojenkinii]|nr:hypothetical protein BGZ83_009969 [Gryganskiella cystojenkinii]